MHFNFQLAFSRTGALTGWMARQCEGIAKNIPKCFLDVDVVVVVSTSLDHEPIGFSYISWNITVSL
jgi:hypothetical protein